MDSLSIAVEQKTTDSFHVENQAGLNHSCLSGAQRLVYNRMILIKRGSGSVYIDDLEYQLGESQLFIISLGQIISFTKDCFFEGLTVIFGDCFWQKTPSSASNCKAVLFNNAADNQLLQLSQTNVRELEFLFETIWLEYSKPGYTNKLDALAAYLKIVMIKASNINFAIARGMDTIDKQLFRKFRELLSTNYQTLHEVSHYSSLMDISNRALSNLSKRCSGKGAKEWINIQLLAEAKRSLQFSSQPVKEIAYELNFSTPDQFSHFFKKNANLSPLDYRKRFTESLS